MERDLTRAGGSLELLEACNPVVRSALAGDGISAALDDLGAATTKLPPGATRTRRLVAGRTVVVVVAVLAITAGVATGAVVLGARTGLFPTTQDQAIGGPGEALNPAASDFRQVALRLAADIPYPSGYGAWRDWVLKVETPTSTATTPHGSPFPAGLVSSGALHGWFAASAFCAWVQNWRQAFIAGDANATAQSTQTIEKAPAWKAITDEDPHPNPSAANDPGAATGTLFGWMLPYRDAVVAGDRARVDHLLATGYGGGKCWSSDPDWMAQVAAHPDWGRLSPSELAQKYEQFLTGGRS
jgi:hypothetical protein